MELKVWLNTSAEKLLIGTLRPAANGRMRFEYASEWMKSTSAVAVSHSLPLQSGVFEGVAVQAFFNNLLPDGVTRQLLAERLSLPVNHGYELLYRTAGDCAGAIDLLPSDVRPDPLRATNQVLSLDELNQLIAFLSQQPMLAGTDDEIRLLLSGSQPKLPITFESEVFALPRNGAVSTHILKLPDDRYPNSITNEAYCMWLAQACGLDVPQLAIVRQTVQPVLLIKRFDRDAVDTAECIHQEDFCQALSVLPEHKREPEGGPSFKTSRELIDQAVLMPALARRRLLEWALFNLVIGNANAHGKKLALLYDDFGQGKLAPFYGLSSTAVYPELSRRTAMAYGGQHDVQHWFAHHRDAFLQDLDVTGRLARQVAKKLASKIEQHAMRLASDKIFTPDEHEFTRLLAEGCLTRLPRIMNF